MNHIGIDPGSKGYMSCIKDNGEIDFFSLAEHIPTEWYDWMSEHQGIVTMEEVHALYNSSAKATFSFGEIFGLLKGLVIALKMPLNLVPPKKWQSDIWNNTDKVFNGGKIDTKKTSINAGQRLYPYVDFRRTAKSRNVDDNKVDSLLIATYAKRHNF